MGNIIGEPFNKYVADQVLARQKLHGTAQRDNSVLSYLNSKTAYIKLTSGVMVSDRNRLAKLGIPDAFMGTQLAKNFIMFSGVSDIRNTMNSDIARTETFINEYAYGLGGLEMGLRPMPGVLSMEAKYRNRGSIRESTVIMKAFNRKQFEIISLLYLRLGFPILLEWGHTISLDSSKTGQPAKVDFSPNFSIANEFLDRKFKGDDDVLDAIEAQRKLSCGNYDAVYGRVVNFDWKFAKDGTYNITLKIISVGAVVESLKMNVYTKDNQTVQAQNKPANDEQPQSDFEWVIKHKYSHNIGNYFYNLVTKKYKTHSHKSNAENGVNVYRRIKNYVSPNWNKMQRELEESKKFNPNNIEFIQVTKPVPKYYIRLGNLLEFIQTSNIPNVVDSISKPNPLINLDYDTDTNFMYVEEYQISSDPRTCIVGGFDIKNDPNDPKPLSILSELSSNPFKTRVKGVLIGLPMNIYVSFSSILSKLETLKNDDGDVNLADFINSILTDLNSSLGSTNQLEFIVDENVGKIIDSTPIPGVEKLIENPELANDSPTFNIYGYYNNGTEEQSAGFVREFGLKTEITNGLVTTLTIGATANGSIVGEDATAFSKWNNGLLPIVNQNIAYQDTTELPRQGLVGPSVISKFIGENKLLRDAYYDYVFKYKNCSYSEDEVDSFVDVVKNFLAFQQQLTNLGNVNNTIKKASATSSKGFLPISLQLTLDGISGIKIYQKIKVDVSFLPIDYPDALKFIIKSVAHKVNSKGWVIDIDTISVPVIETIEDQNKEAMPNKPNAPQKANTDNRAESRNFVNADKLRKTLSELGYTEKGKEITSSETDINSPIEKAASHILRTIKQELPSVKVTVTGGNDKFHKDKSPTSRHTKGNAIDFVISPVTPANLDAVVLILRRYAAGNSPNFRYIDEYRNLSRHGTGNHFHISWGAGTEGQTALNESVKLAQEGKIKPIQVA